VFHPRPARATPSRGNPGASLGDGPPGEYLTCIRGVSRSHQFTSRVRQPSAASQKNEVWMALFGDLSRS
jgi:hypothetical protein